MQSLDAAVKIGKINIYLELQNYPYCQICKIFNFQFSIYNEFTMNQFSKYQSLKFKCQNPNAKSMSKFK